MGYLKAETLTPVLPDKEIYREVEGVSGWTTLGRYYAQPFNIMTAAFVLKRAQAFTRQRRASHSLRTVVLSSDVSGWSATKDVQAEGRLGCRGFLAWAHDACMAGAVRVAYTQMSRQGLSSEWLQDRFHRFLPGNRPACRR